jgi:hypothetical protein
MAYITGIAGQFPTDETTANNSIPKSRAANQGLN